MKRLILLLALSILSVPCFALGGYKQNVVTQPTFEHKVDSCTINYYDVNFSTQQIFSGTDYFRVRVFYNLSTNTKNIYIGPLPSVTSNGTSHPTAGIILTPGSQWIEDMYFGDWYAVSDGSGTAVPRLLAVEERMILQ